MEQINFEGIDILFKKMAKTPRIALNFFFKIHKKEKLYGINLLLSRLLLQGTKKYNALELSKEFEQNCIDISFKTKQDYIKASLIFLNEDLYKATELFKELILNSTFDDFEKEVLKVKGEIIADLDNPKIKLTDAFVKNIFKNHPYSETHTKILDDINKITKKDIIEAHENLLNCEKNIVVVGDIENKEEFFEYFKKEFLFMKSNVCRDEIEDIFSLKTDENIWLTKNDASQAQIIQGWLVDSFKSNDCAKLAVLNNILGASGLSSRLFVNLRDKQGLAYTVRSQYETFLHSGIFSLYIGTAPINIKKSLQGFKDELKKIAEVAPNERELEGAKENISGRMKYFTQNNAQIASVYGYNHIMGLGLDYNKRFLNEINRVKSNHVSDMANKLLNSPKLTVIIAPEDFKSDSF